MGPGATGRWGATAIGALGIVLWATETALASLTGGLPVFEIVGLAFAAASLLSPLGWWMAGESPFLAFRQKWWVWAITVPLLVGYHACIYAAVHHVPAAPAALLQGCTPLFIVFGSAVFCGLKLRWWHLAGAAAGLEGMVALALENHGPALQAGASLYLLEIGLAAGLWGLYSLLSSRFTAVPTSAMGLFYAASAVLALALHIALEPWVMPTLPQWSAIGALGLMPMGLALFCWDFGLKKGDVQSLGIASYVEPVVGAALVVAMGQGTVHASMLVSGLVIIGAAVLGSANLFEPDRTAEVLDKDMAIGSLPVWLPLALRNRLRAAARMHGVPVQTMVERCLERALGDGEMLAERANACERRRAA